MSIQNRLTGSKDKKCDNGMRNPTKEVPYIKAVIKNPTLNTIGRCALSMGGGKGRFGMRVFRSSFAYIGFSKKSMPFAQC